LFFPFCRFRLVLVLHKRQRTRTGRNGERRERRPEEGWQGVSVSAVSAKHVLSFGTKPARPKRLSEPRKRRPPGSGRSEK
jgi:hypothetical protein